MLIRIQQKIRSARVTGSLLGPAFVAAIAYVDPGNFATNLGAGSQYGYMLLWVLIVANLMASLVQYLSAKVGLVTGQSLPEVVRDKLGSKSRVLYWMQAELVALASDVAEVLGGAIALNMLFSLPLFVGGVITIVVSLLLLLFQNRGQRTFERVIIGLLLIIPIGFVVGLFLQPPDAARVVGGLVPKFDGTDSLLLATGMLGATLMPHVVYLHSALAHDRHGKPAKKHVNNLLRATRFDVGIAMVLAGGANIAMLLLAASALHGLSGTGDLPGIFHALETHVSALVAVLFGVSLLVSCLASTSVGCYAGAVIMDCMIHKRIPMILRRSLTAIPALILLATGLNPTHALILSQVALSFGVPFAVIPLVMVSSNRKIMGEFKNSRYVTLAASLVAAVVVILNFVLIGLTVRG